MISERMSKNVLKLSIADALHKLACGDVSSEDLALKYLDQIKKHKDINAYISTYSREDVICAAKESDTRIANGNARILEGIPIAIKDLFCTKDLPTTAGSEILRNFTPPYESTVTQKLRDAGCVLLGKTNLDQFGMGSTTTHSAFGATINPWKANDGSGPHLAGGSSGGSAAAVASGQAMAAIGTDTGGSCRQPAAFCGVFGMKASYGRCSRLGIIPFASSFDQAGVLTRNAKDANLILHAISGYDSGDPTSVDMPPIGIVDFTESISKIRVGIPGEYNVRNHEISDLQQSGIAWLKEAGASVVDVSLPHTKFLVPMYYVIACAEAASSMAKYDGIRYGKAFTNLSGKSDLNLPEEISKQDAMYFINRSYGLGDEVRRRIIMGTYFLSSGHREDLYIKAQKMRSVIIDEFNAAFEKCDVLLVPTTPTSAFSMTDTPSSYDQYMADILTIGANAIGAPAASIPCGKDKNGMPIALQVIGKGFDDETVLRVADALCRYNVEISALNEGG